MNHYQLASYWDGEMSWLEILSIKSMYNHGNRLNLYSYNPDALLKYNLPCIIRDAREIIPETHIAYRYVLSRYFTIFSNYFRLALQSKNCGMWIDCDCLLLRPFPDLGDYVFGRTYDGKINTAVMKLPNTEPMVADYMNAITADPMRLPWATFRRRVYRNFEILIGKKTPDINRRTGVGPRAFTYYLDKHHLSDRALAPYILYPVQSNQATKLVEADRRFVDQRISQETILVHLWQGYLKHFGFRTSIPPAGSYLGDACRNYGID